MNPVNKFFCLFFFQLFKKNRMKQNISHRTLTDGYIEIELSIGFLYVSCTFRSLAEDDDKLYPTARFLIRI